MIRVRGPATLRVRIIVAFLGGALVVSGLVASVSYGFARSYLLRQRLQSVQRSGFNALRYATEYLASQRPNQTADELVRAMQVRSAGEVVLVENGQTIASSVTVSTESVPSRLREAVEAGDVAYVVADDPPAVWFASGIPHTDMSSFMRFPLVEVRATLRILARILIVVAAVTVGAAAFAGSRVARVVASPLRQASEAARRVTQSLIHDSVEPADGDELAMLSTSFNEMAGALQERIARERRFVADASHELRTPLTALRSSIEYVAERRSHLPEEVSAAAGVAHAEVKALQRLIDDLLELSALESGGIAPREEPIDLAEFTRQVVARRVKHAPVEISWPEEPLVARSDKQLLERVVGNLVDNAVTHGRRNVRVAVFIRDGRPSIRVSDAGPGIKPQNIDRVFERFFREGPSRGQTDSPGSGLGLAIAHENAAIIRAEIEVESSREGTHMTVVLPREPDR